MDCIDLRSEQSLQIAIAVTGGIMALEIFGAVVSGSLALLSDAWHMLTDLLALILCLIAGKMALKPPTSDKTFGYYRVEILSALVNGIMLFLITFYILYEAYNRFVYPVEVRTVEMIVVALIGFVSNLVSMTVLSRSMMSLNVKSAFLHVFGDALSSLGVIVAGILMHFTRWYYVDPILSVVIACIIIVSTGRMMREVIHILLEGVPRKVDIREVDSTVRSVEGVVDIHDIHVWSITSYIHYMTAHIVVDELSASEKIMNKVKTCIEEKYRIRHTTFQIETKNYSEIGEVHYNKT